MVSLIYYLLNKLKKDYLRPNLEIKNIKNNEKTCYFCVFEQKSPKCYFSKYFSLPTNFEY